MCITAFRCTRLIFNNQQVSLSYGFIFPVRNLLPPLKLKKNCLFENTWRTIKQNCLWVYIIQLQTKSKSTPNQLWIKATVITANDSWFVFCKDPSSDHLCHLRSLKGHLPCPLMSSILFCSIVSAYRGWKKSREPNYFFSQGLCAPVTTADLCQSIRKRTSEDIQHFTLDKSEGSTQ